MQASAEKTTGAARGVVAVDDKSVVDEAWATWARALRIGRPSSKVMLEERGGSLPDGRSVKAWTSWSRHVSLEPQRLPSQAPDRCISIRLAICIGVCGDCTGRRPKGTPVMRGVRGFGGVRGVPNLALTGLALKGLELICLALMGLLELHGRGTRRPYSAFNAVRGSFIVKKGSAAPSFLDICPGGRGACMPNIITSGGCPAGRIGKISDVWCFLDADCRLPRACTSELSSP
mmetsp:Transcript_13707/g.25999  ORF Transcript_13707/g.25999 Transcript_13707/m.25999 type:complete len:232 (-) Transcript_13707:1239-1934(-)